MQLRFSIHHNKCINKINLLVYGTKYSRMVQVKFVEDSLITISLQIFSRLFSTNFTWFTLENFSP